LVVVKAKLHRLGSQFSEFFPYSFLGKAKSTRASRLTARFTATNVDRGTLAVLSVVPLSSPRCPAQSEAQQRLENLPMAIKDDVDRRGTWYRALERHSKVCIDGAPAE
ncbi:hypothetical protein, partial [Rhizobium lusitanum]|uniref:hypothetical protein n=1 Tax=Rhizobium lusitanum TaxID=293958 RepID=UPI00195CDF0B